jgi:hypothetical protein
MSSGNIAKSTMSFIGVGNKNPAVLPGAVIYIVGRVRLVRVLQTSQSCWG